MGSSSFAWTEFQAGIEPAGPSLQPITCQRLTDSPPALAAVWQRNQDPNCRCLTLAGSDDSSNLEASIEFIRRAWPNLQPHIREALFILIDAALLQDEGE